MENNYNFCELGPRGTGKSHVYKEISPNSILVSGGQTTVANLFYNMASKQIVLVGLWDCVAFDEVAGITFKDKDGVQIMKDYMASGSFAHLFEPFPEAMGTDTAFLDRMHCYLPGWEIPKYRPEYFTDIDIESFSEEYVPVPEQGGGSLIPEGIGKPGHVYHVSPR